MTKLIHKTIEFFKKPAVIALTVSAALLIGTGAVLMTRTPAGDSGEGISLADTQGMDFSFDSEDLNAADVSGAVELIIPVQNGDGLSAVTDAAPSESGDIPDTEPEGESTIDTADTAPTNGSEEPPASSIEEASASATKRPSSTTERRPVSDTDADTEDEISAAVTTREPDEPDEPDTTTARPAVTTTNRRPAATTTAATTTKAPAATTTAATTTKAPAVTTAATTTKAPSVTTTATTTKAPAVTTTATTTTKAPAVTTTAAADNSGGESQGSTNGTTITSGGTYSLTGTYSDVMIVIDAGDEDVTLILNGVTIKNSATPAVFVRSAGKVTLTLAAGTQNTLSDGASYSITDSDSVLDATVFSKADLTVNGSGTLNVRGNYKHAIVSKDELVIASGVLNVTSAGVGLCGKDCVKLNSGTVTVNAGSDGIRSDNEEDTSRGYVYVYGGTLNITAGNDGIQAVTVLKIEDANLTITAGGGSSASLSSSESHKGLKAGSDIYISGGIFKIDSLDDCIHSNGTITVSGGTYTLSSGDDGVHADTDLSVSGASTSLTVTKSYEGLEATNVLISGGTVSVTASDDGLNAAGGSDSSSSSSGRPGQGNFTGSTGTIVISGGEIRISANGDGIDANGNVNITGGLIYVSGANSGDTSILDYDSTGTISGGTFVGTGASSMVQNFSSSSTQGVILLKTSSMNAGTLITLKDSAGSVVLSHTAERAFSCIILSHPSIVKGGTYTLTAGSASYSITMTSTVYQQSSSSGGSTRPGR